MKSGTPCKPARFEERGAVTGTADPTAGRGRSSRGPALGGVDDASRRRPCWARCLAMTPTNKIISRTTRLPSKQREIFDRTFPSGAGYLLDFSAARSQTRRRTLETLNRCLDGRKGDLPVTARANRPCGRRPVPVGTALLGRARHDPPQRHPAETQ